MLEGAGRTPTGGDPTALHCTALLECPQSATLHPRTLAGSIAAHCCHSAHSRTPTTPAAQHGRSVHGVGGRAGGPAALPAGEPGGAGCAVLPCAAAAGGPGGHHLAEPRGGRGGGGRNFWAGPSPARLGSPTRCRSRSCRWWGPSRGPGAHDRRQQGAKRCLPVDRAFQPCLSRPWSHTASMCSASCNRGCRRRQP